MALPFGSHFLQQEILNALKDLEIPAIKLPQENNNPNELEEILMLKFWENRPSLVLSVNGKGIDSEGILINVCKRFSVSLHIWFVDDPRPIVCLYSKSQCENITVWTWEKAYIPYLKEKNFYRVAYLPLAGDPHLFYPSKINTPLQHNLVFTGSAMASSFLDEIWRHITYNKTEVLPIAENAAFQILTGAMTADQMPGETKEESWFSSLAIHTASREKRRLCLEPLLPLGLQFAGDPKGWRELFGNNIKTLPDIDYRTNLREHYSKGNIHINITSCQMPNAVNQRVFDIPLCGRFVISDNQNDLFELFSSDAICAAATPEEYADLAKFHIANPNAKNEIVKKAQECIINNHTYKHRLSVILQADSKI
ncbi:hypothetical protein AGMMS49938_03670 [Fibrobacterales bacterium]|nr:hypothetical protein AGMMS49938_03670 [Fibrobacterales bacterium]